MKNKQLEKLKKQHQEIRKEIYNIEKIDENKREKEMEKLVGCCVKSEYYDFAFRRILDYCYHKDYGIYFIYEEVKINEQGESSVSTTSNYPYVNKEWASEKIPVSGWSEEITEKEYQLNKEKVLAEMLSRKKIKKFLIKR